MSFGQHAVDSELVAAQQQSQRLRPALRRVVAVFNGKGGVGKTSLTANLAGLLALAAADAQSPRRVLVVDCDPQGNVGLDLGYAKGPADDDGRGLVQAMVSGGRPTVIRDVRPWLDVIPGGAALDEVNGIKFGKISSGKVHESRLALAQVLATVGEEYDWILVDCPPRETNLQDMVLVAARAVLVPVSFDQGSRQGLSGVSDRFGQALQLNESLELLGVAMFGFQYRTSKNGDEVGQRKAVRAEFTADLAAAGTSAKVFDTVIRYQATVAKSARDRGQLVYELETAVGPKWWEIRSGKASGRPVPNTEAAKVAQEYEDLAAEVFTRFMQLEQA